MDVYELIKQVGAEIVNNRARALIDGERVVVAEVGENGMALTEAGEAIAATLKPAPKPAPKPKAAAKSAPETTE